MSAGVPVIASDFPLWRTLVEEAGAGLLVDPLDPRAIGEAIGWLLDHPEAAAAMGERGRAAVGGDLNWDHEARSCWPCTLRSRDEDRHGHRGAPAVHQGGRLVPRRTRSPGTSRS
jgi:hypothetical protein